MKVISFAPSEHPALARKVNEYMGRDFPETWERIRQMYIAGEQEQDLFDRDRETTLLDPTESDNFVFMSSQRLWTDIKQLTEVAQ